MQKIGWTLNINIEWKIMMIFLLNDAKLFIFIEHLGSYILSHVCDLFCKNVEWRSVRKSFLHSTHPKYLLHILHQPAENIYHCTDPWAVVASIQLVPE